LPATPSIQPLDKGLKKKKFSKIYFLNEMYLFGNLLEVFGPAKVEWRSILKEYYEITTNKIVKKIYFPLLLKHLFDKQFTRKQAIDGFENTGLHPLDKIKISAAYESIPDTPVQTKKKAGVEKKLASDAKKKANLEKKKQSEEKNLKGAQKLETAAKKTGKRKTLPSESNEAKRSKGTTL
jgi:hypothetical protein